MAQQQRISIGSTDIEAVSTARARERGVLCSLRPSREAIAATASAAISPGNASKLSTSGEKNHSRRAAAGTTLVVAIRALASGTLRNSARAALLHLGGSFQFIPPIHKFSFRSRSGGRKYSTGTFYHVHTNIHMCGYTPLPTLCAWYVMVETQMTSGLPSCCRADSRGYAASCHNGVPQEEAGVLQVE